ncbi:MAG: hypothetical protein EXR67_06475 [Dehalococcoidia bacterium]|nr:hypothetical protein [Dehalococcoidia bacterium]
MYYEIRMHTPQKGKAEEYGKIFHEKGPQLAYENGGTQILGMFLTEEEQPTFVWIIAYKDKAHQAAFRKTMANAPEMAPYRPLRAQYLDANVPNKDWSMKPTPWSKLQ